VPTEDGDVLFVPYGEHRIRPEPPPISDQEVLFQNLKRAYDRITPSWESQPSFEEAVEQRARELGLVEPPA